MYVFLFILFSILDIKKYCLFQFLKCIFFVTKNLGEGMVPQFKVGETFKLKEHLQRYLHLPPSKGTSGARTPYHSNSRPVFLPLDLWS